MVSVDVKPHVSYPAAHPKSAVRGCCGRYAPWKKKQKNGCTRTHTSMLVNKTHLLCTHKHPSVCAYTFVCTQSAQLQRGMHKQTSAHFVPAPDRAAELTFSVTGTGDLARVFDLLYHPRRMQEVQGKMSFTATCRLLRQRP